MTQTHYDPRGVVEADSLTAAARATSLKGKRLAISPINAFSVLDSFEAAFEKTVELRMHMKTGRDMIEFLGNFLECLFRNSRRGRLKEIFFGGSA